MDPNQITKMNPRIVVIKEENSKVRCDFCRKSEINDMEWGPMCRLDDIVVHYFCMLFSSALRQNGKDTDGILGFLPVDLQKEMKRGAKLRCRHCRLNRATVGCAVKQCNVSFHFSCGIPNGALNQFSGSFSSYCSTHKPAIKIPIPQNEWKCEICFVMVEPDEFPVWPPCCKRRVFHRMCIQNYAANSGYFFSCPCCKDKEVFIRAMKDSGVYVPEQDATWELAPNAFAELNQMYSHCDAEECLCPRGRSYNCPDNRSWKIVRCGSCGSSAVHFSCGQLSLVKWKCPECVNVLARDPSHYRMVVLEGASSSGESDEEEFTDEEEDSCSGSFRTTDENCRIAIAARSNLSGVERDADRVCNPVDYISSADKILPWDHAGETREARDVRLKRLEDSKRIIYNRNFRKKYKMDLASRTEDSDSPDYDTGEDDQDTYATKRTRLVSSYFTEYVNSNISTNSEGQKHFIANTEDFHGTLAKLRISCMLKQNCVSESKESYQARPTELLNVSNRNLKAMCKAKNLDLSEYESKALAKFISLPTFETAVVLSEDSKSRDCNVDLSDNTSLSNNDIHLALDRQTQNHPSFIDTHKSVKTSPTTEREEPSNTKSANNEETSFNQSLQVIMDNFKDKLDEFDSDSVEELDDLFATAKTVRRRKPRNSNLSPSKDNQQASTVHTEIKSIKQSKEAVEPTAIVKTPEKCIKPDNKLNNSASEEIEIVEEFFSPKKNFEVINLDDTVLEDDDCVEIVMESKSPKKLSPFKQEGTWFSGCDKPVVKSSALLQVLKTDQRVVLDEEILVVSDEDENHTEVDDDDCGQSSTSSSTKRCREDNTSRTKKSRLGSCDFETRSPQCKKRNEGAYRNRIATKTFTVEMNRPKLF